MPTLDLGAWTRFALLLALLADGLFLAIAFAEQRQSKKEEKKQQQADAKVQAELKRLEQEINQLKDCCKNKKPLP